MASVSFHNLLNIYRHTAFDPSGDGGVLDIATDSVLSDIELIEASDVNARDANISLLNEPSGLAVGQQIPIRISAPRLALGLLCRDFDGLLNAPGARLEQCTNFYVINLKLGSDNISGSDVFCRYLKVLDFIKLLSDAAAYFDKTKQELVLLKNGKFSLPVLYNEKVLMELNYSTLEEMVGFFSDDTHRDQKLEILSEAILYFSQGQLPNRRFTYILENIADLFDDIKKGYKLFVSTFSYAKIRSELEAIKLTYITQIHKTLVDIQGQLLGIPVATIVVASQLKAVTSCDINLWTDIGVLLGAWVFFILLVISIVNQWVTLSAINGDVCRQRAKMKTDFAAISDQFVDIFDGLVTRIKWHRRALIGVAVVAALGSLCATVAFINIANPAIRNCFATQKPPSLPAVAQTPAHQNGASPKGGTQAVMSASRSSVASTAGQALSH